MKEMETQSKLSLKLQAYQYLKTKILNCEYRPNEFLNEQKLCAEMGNISRTPMRDALGRLEQEGLITILPKKGLMVSGITEEDVHSMFEMRLLVEPYALRTYGDRIPREALENYTELMHHPERISDFCESDDGFHELLMSTLPNKYLRSAYDRITGLNPRFRIMTGKVSMINQEQTCEEHLEQAGDVPAAGGHQGPVDPAISGQRKGLPLHPLRQMRDRVPPEAAHPCIAGPPARGTGRTVTQKDPAPDDAGSFCIQMFTTDG